jgi:hypothetical protein
LSAAEDEVIAEVCGVDVPRYACGHVRGFGTGFGYRDPLARCRACRDKDSVRALWLCIGFAVTMALALVWLLERHP